MNIYSPLNKAAFYMIQKRQRAFREILARRFDDSMKDLSFLEIGCGNGQWLAEFQTFGLQVKNMCGIELDETRTKEAQKRIIGADIRSGNAATLPWNDNSFDIVFQSTVFTSILDDEIRKNVASEMKRVCKPGGLILWYDFTFNSPNNPNVRGIKRNEVLELFKLENTKFKNMTLAPPISRRLVPLSWLLSDLIESCCPFLCTHVIAEMTAE